MSKLSLEVRKAVEYAEQEMADWVMKKLLIRHRTRMRTK